MLRYKGKIFFFFWIKKNSQKKKEEERGYNENVSIQEILTVYFDLCNEIKKSKANFKAFQSNITEINLKATFNILNHNLSSLACILTEFFFKKNILMLLYRHYSFKYNRTT